MIAQQLGQRLVDQPLPRHAVQPGKGCAFHHHAEVRFARSIVPRMAAVKRAFVDYLKVHRVERCGETGGDGLLYGAGGRRGHRAYIAGFAGDVLILAKDRPNARFHGRIEGDRPCEAPGCEAAGEFRAPPLEGPGGDGPGTYRWFCLDHVRAFNSSYNYFDGMTSEEINRAQRPMAGWERETRAFARAGAGDQGPRWADFADPLDAIGARFRREVAPERSDGKPLSGQDRASLKVLGLAPDADRTALRRRYSELVRQYHPDRNGGDRSHEGMLQKVIAAYQQLRQAPAFA